MHRTPARHLVVLLAAACLPALASATAQRTFVASTGSDANACSIAAPCRGFAAAVAETSPGGEVIVLDSAGYGIVTIAQPVSIIAPPGVYAGISVFTATDGIVVNAANFDRVVLRGLTINGQGGDRGIVVTNGQVHIEDCTVSGMANDGIRVDGNTSVHIARTLVRSNSEGLHVAGGNPEVHVTDSRFTRNLLNGILVEAGMFDATRIVSENNARGMLVQPADATLVRATVTESSFVGNSANGFSVNPNVIGSTVVAAVSRSHFAHNSSHGVAAVASIGTATVVVSASSIADNGSSGIQASGANSIVIVGDNVVAGHTSADMLQSNSGEIRTSLTNTLSGRGAVDVSGVLTANPLK